VPSEYVAYVPLGRGLRARVGPKDGSLMSELVGARAGEAALTPFETVTNGITGVDTAVDWPWPQLLRTEAGSLLGFETALYSVNEGTLLASELTTYNAGDVDAEKEIESGGAWSLASFHDMWVATNGASVVYSLPSNDGKYLTASSPLVNSVCALDGRLFLGGLSGDYFAGVPWGRLMAAWLAHAGDRVVTHEDMAVDSKWVMWSEPAGGGFDWPYYSVLAAAGFGQAADWAKVEEALITALKLGDIGLAPMPTHGSVLQVVPQGNRVVVLCSDVVVALEPHESTFLPRVLSTVGAVSRTGGVCVGGVVLFVGTDGRLWGVREGERATRLGYSEYFGSADSDTVADVDEMMEDAYFCWGGSTYVWHNGELCERELVTTSVGRLTGTLWGISEDTGAGWVAGTGVGAASEGEYEVGLVSGVLQFGQADLVELRSVELVASDVVAARVGAYYKHGQASDFVEMSCLPGSPEGVFFPRCSGIEFKLKVGLLLQEDSVVEGLRVRFMYDGSRNIRGPRVTGMSLDTSVARAG